MHAIPAGLRIFINVLVSLSLGVRVLKLPPIEMYSKDVSTPALEHVMRKHNSDTHTHTHTHTHMFKDICMDFKKILEPQASRRCPF